MCTIGQLVALFYFWAYVVTAANYTLDHNLTGPLRPSRFRFCPGPTDPSPTSFHRSPTPTSRGAAYFAFAFRPFVSPARPDRLRGGRHASNGPPPVVPSWRRTHSRRWSTAPCMGTAGGAGGHQGVDLGRRRRLSGPGTHADDVPRPMATASERPLHHGGHLLYDLHHPLHRLRLHAGSGCNVGRVQLVLKPRCSAAYCAIALRVANINAFYSASGGGGGGGGLDGGARGLAMPGG